MTKATKKRVFRARDIGKTIKRLRRVAHKSQKEVAHKAGISLQTISNIEVGRVMPDLESLCGIAYGIGVEPHVLMQHGLAEAVGLNELMKHAGFTQGGFYNHFKSKAALVCEVLASAMAEGIAEIAKGARAPVDASTTALRRYISHYLSRTHRDNIDHGCPVAGFAGDASRLGADAQSHFARGLDDQITILAGLIAESGSSAAADERRTLRERAISLHCEMVGALILSRSVAQAAPAVSNGILENVQRHVLASLEEGSSQGPKPRKKH